MDWQEWSWIWHQKWLNQRVVAIFNCSSLILNNDLRNLKPWLSATTVIVIGVNIVTAIYIVYTTPSNILTLKNLLSKWDRKYLVWDLSLAQAACLYTILRMLGLWQITSMSPNSTYNQDIASTIASRSDELRWEI